MSSRTVPGGTRLAYRGACEQPNGSGRDTTRLARERLSGRAVVLAVRGGSGVGGGTTFAYRGEGWRARCRWATFSPAEGEIVAHLRPGRRWQRSVPAEGNFRCQLVGPHHEADIWDQLIGFVTWEGSFRRRDATEPALFRLSHVFRQVQRLCGDVGQRGEGQDGFPSLPSLPTTALPLSRPLGRRATSRPTTARPLSRPLGRRLAAPPGNHPPTHAERVSPRGSHLAYPVTGESRIGCSGGRAPPRQPGQGPNWRTPGGGPGGGGAAGCGGAVAGGGGVAGGVAIGGGGAPADAGCSFRSDASRERSDRVALWLSLRLPGLRGSPARPCRCSRADPVRRCFAVGSRPLLRRPAPGRERSSPARRRSPIRSDGASGARECEVAIPVRPTSGSSGGGSGGRSSEGSNRSAPAPASRAAARRRAGPRLMVIPRICPVKPEAPADAPL